MFKKISVLVPTRQRTTRLRTLLMSFARMSTPFASELVFRVDEDDISTQQLLQNWKWRVFVGSQLDGYRSMPQFLEDAISVAHGDVLMVGNDDMVFETSGWDELVLAEVNKYPDGIFNIGLETLNTDHFPFSIISRLAYIRLGCFYDPRLFWGDIFLRDVMSYFGRAVLLPGVKVTHDWAGHDPDAVFQSAQHLKTTIGTPDYWQFHHRVVQEAVERLS